jgi:omega-amidase
MRIAAAQISCSLGDPPGNLRKVESSMSCAQKSGADLVVFPEMVDTGYALPAIRTHAAPWTEGFVPGLQRLAKELSLAVVCGVSERDGETIYNSQIVLDPTGKVIASYRKTHLFTAPPLEEHLCFTPGNSLAEFAFRDLRFGLSICYDLRFPEVYRNLAIHNHVNVFVISSAWPFPRLEHFRTLAVARAIENQSYVVAANRVGTDGEVAFCGTSAIIDPYGVVVAAASPDREELIVAELSAEAVSSVRSRMGVFADRRSDLYD